jgi:hypothetical protein
MMGMQFRVAAKRLNSLTLLSRTLGNCFLSPIHSPSLLLHSMIYLDSRATFCVCMHVCLQARQSGQSDADYCSAAQRLFIFQLSPPQHLGRTSTLEDEGHAQRLLVWSFSNIQHYKMLMIFDFSELRAFIVKEVGFACKNDDDIVIVQRRQRRQRRRQ